MSETLCMMEIEQLLEELSYDALQADGQELHELKRLAIKTLIHHYCLDPEDAESQVAAACGEEP